MKKIAITSLTLMLAVVAPHSSAFAKGPNCKGQETAAKNASKALTNATKDLAKAQKALDKEVSKVNTKNETSQSKADRYKANVDKLGVKLSGFCPGDITTTVTSFFTQASGPSTAGVVCTAANSSIGKILNGITEDLMCNAACALFDYRCNDCKAGVSTKKKSCEMRIANTCGEAVKQGKLAKMELKKIDPTIVNCTVEQVAKNEQDKPCKNAIARRNAGRIGLPTTAGSLSKAVVDATAKNDLAQAALVCCQQGLPAVPGSLQCGPAPTPIPSPTPR